MSILEVSKEYSTPKSSVFYQRNTRQNSEGFNKKLAN